MMQLDGRDSNPNKPPNELTDLENSTCALVLEVLRSRILDRTVTLDFVEAWWTQAQNTASGRCYWCLNIEVCSNSPQLVRGSFNHLTDAGVFGYNTLYLQGYIDAFFKSQGAHLDDSIAVHVSVLQDDSSASPGQHPKYLSLAEAVSQGLVAKGSPIAHYANKYDLPYVAIFGPGVIGPTTEMIAALEQLWVLIDAKSVLDVFAGTGSLGKVCLALGADSVFSLEQVPPSDMEQNRGDARKAVVTGNYDLALVDQFVEDVAMAAEQILPQLAPHCRYVLWNLGSTAHRGLFAQLLLNLPMWREEQVLLVNDCHIAWLASKL